MAIQKTKAILLKKRDFRETSFILTFLTRDFGKIDGILKGARGNRARSGVTPLFFSLGQVIYYEKKRSNLFIISECETQDIFFNILKDWLRVSVAYYILELVDVFTEPGEKVESIFESLLQSLVSLDTKKEPNSIARLFEVKFLSDLGLWPGSETFKLTRGALSTLLSFEQKVWQGASKIKLTSEMNEEIKGITEKIIADNLDRPLKTVKVLG